ncbi:MAG TPA: hypothetical protein VNP04_06055 [Alphaproteobacteria bacterium]|nr:hypothetical protein [Alphaproteobacteria bacterium]
MTARVLADHVDTVIILERDSIDGQPALHRSIPQGNHLHTLLLGGQQIMARLSPGLVARLASLGTVCCRASMEIAFCLPSGKADSLTGTVRERRDLGFQTPEETTSGVDRAYASAKFRVPEHYEEPERLMVFMGAPRDSPKSRSRPCGRSRCGVGLKPTGDDALWHEADGIPLRPQDPQSVVVSPP